MSHCHVLGVLDVLSDSIIITEKSNLYYSVLLTQGSPSEMSKDSDQGCVSPNYMVFSFNHAVMYVK